MKHKDGSYHYSGDGSKQFWMRVNALPEKSQYAMYSLGCALQNLEEFTLSQLRQEEARSTGRVGKTPKGKQ